MNNIYISQNNYNKFFIFSDNKPILGRNERCGILTGKKIENKGYFISSVIEDETPIDYGSFHVYRTTSHVYPQLLKKIERDNKIDYLGEWHTHPFGPPSASRIDITTMKNMLYVPRFGDISWVVLLIILSYNSHEALLFTAKSIEKLNLIIR